MKKLESFKELLLENTPQNLVDHAVNVTVKTDLRADLKGFELEFNYDMGRVYYQPNKGLIQYYVNGDLKDSYRIRENDPHDSKNKQVAHYLEELYRANF